MKTNLEIKNEIIEIIKNNIDKKTNEIIWLDDIRKYNYSTASLLVLIDDVKNN